MTLLEMSVYYADSAALLRTRMAQLRAMEREAENPETARRLRLRIETLRPPSAGNAGAGRTDCPILRQELSQT